MELLQMTGKYAGQMRKNFSDEEFAEICSQTKFVSDSSRKSIRERVFCILNGICEIPKCPECGNDVEFNNSHGLYSRFCSKKCRYGSKTLRAEIGKAQKECTTKQETKLKNSALKFLESQVLVFLDKNGWIRRDFSNEEFAEICSLTPFVSDPSRKSIRERVFCILNDISEIPDCEECNNKVLFKGKFTKYCSKECANSSISKVLRSKNTKLNLYGDENYVNPGKANETCVEKYGVEHTSKLPQNRQQAKQTNLERHGDENYNNAEQAKQTCLEKYGVDNAAKSKEVRDKLSISLAKNFQERRNEDGDYSGVVYILHFPELRAIKIGLTASQEGRFKALENDFGEFSVIELIETSECFKLESYLHEKFDGSRICFDEGCGRTEFFKEEILNDVLDYLLSFKTSSML